ncbi:casein kinase II subunit beta, putative [Babesia caballi]|uniref:Casein kinase II subunit beta, putative n=1 Tax=Babesia caballi TaxID=5871 RepID=A0AAV4LX78_BABCB|nr:casein kinase II subunit beta, putative [Babesia caballi]
MQTRRSARAAAAAAVGRRTRSSTAAVTAAKETAPAETAKPKFFTATAVNDDGSIRQGAKSLQGASDASGDGLGGDVEKKLMSHWLFSDEGTGFKPPKVSRHGLPRTRSTSIGSAKSAVQVSTPKMSMAKASGHHRIKMGNPVGGDMATPAAPKPQAKKETSGFTLASGKACPAVRRDDIAKMKSLLGLDELESAGVEIDVPLSMGSVAAAGGIEKAVLNVSRGHRAHTHAKRHKSKRNHGVVNAANAANAVADEEVEAKAHKEAPEKGVMAEAVVKQEAVVPAATRVAKKFVCPPKSRRVNLLELWCRTCVLTNHDGSSLSPSMLSRLWNIYGNPLNVTYSTSEKFTFIHYSPFEASITVGGLNEMQECFTLMVDQCVERSMERLRFDATWLRQKYCLFTAAECRRFRRAICRRLRKGAELKHALLKVQLPNPLTVMRRIVKAFNEEYGGTESVLVRILQGDAPADAPVVVRVEDVDGDNLVISDGDSIISASAADCYVKQLCKTQRIAPGSKIQLNGVAIGAAGETSGGDTAVVQLFYNAISPAPKKKLGLQMKHGNVHIRELKVGAGKVAQLDVTVLGVMPPVFKIFYKEADSNKSKSAVLSEWDFNALFGDPMYRPPVTIENVYVHHTLHVIDTVILLRIKDYLQDPQKFENALIKSCALVTLRSVDETVMGMVKPTTRLTLTSLVVRNAAAARRENRLTERGAHIGNYLCFETTTQSRMDLKERDTPLHQIRTTVAEYQKGAKNADTKEADDELVMGGPKSIFHTLILGEPALSISPHNEREFFELMRRPSEEPESQGSEMFLDQVCSLTGVVLEASEISTAGRDARFFRFFVLTTRFKIAVIKVMERVVMIPTQEGTQQNACAKLERVHRRLLAQRLTLAAAPKTAPKKKETLFLACVNLQYAGFDEDHGLYNFSTSSSKIVLRECAILQKLQARLHDGLVFAEGKGYALSRRALAAAGDDEMGGDCRAFARELAKAKLKVCRIQNSGADDVALCEELAAGTGVVGHGSGTPP